jgi:CHAT domain-containing protein
MLYLSELIGGQKPATNLIVLSACNTGIGKLHIGEGVFSFNRGFAALGIPASISSLWSVEKASTIQLTEFFYKYLDKGEPTDVALQHAKLDFLKSASERNKLPYYWAGTILAGKAERIDCKKPFPWITVLIIAGCIVLLCVFVYSKKSSTNHNF